MLKSDLRGIETYYNNYSQRFQISLKSDLRGIETLFRIWNSYANRALKSDLRGIETGNYSYKIGYNPLVKIRP